MKSILVLLLLTSYSLFSQTKDEIINKFLNFVESKKNIHFSIIETTDDEAKGISSHTANCSFFKAAEDTITGFYYYIQTGSGTYIYNKNEYLEYYPEIYGFKTVKTVSKKKNPEKFQKQEFEMGGQKVYANPLPMSSIFWDASIAGHYSELKKEKNTKQWIVLQDTAIGCNLCQRIMYETRFIYEGDTSKAYAVYSFDYETGMLIYYKVWMPVQQREELYMNFVYDKPKAEKLITRNAFPKGTKFAEKPKEIEKKQKTLLKVGQKAPEWELMNLDDKKVSLQGLSGTPVFLVFTEIGCVPCMMAIPIFIELVKEYPAVKFISIYSKDKKDALVKLKAKKEMNYDILYNSSNDDAKKTHDEYHINGYPSYYLIDGNGIIKYKGSGYGDGMKKYWVEEIEKVIKQ